jgi:hypothetical protein
LEVVLRVRRFVPLSPAGKGIVLILPLAGKGIVLILPLAGKGLV